MFCQKFGGLGRHRRLGKTRGWLNGFSKMMRLPFIKVEASKYTEVGLW